MARRPRLLVPGAIYHVMSRGNRKAIIVEDDFDRLVFIETLSSSATLHGMRVYAFCLMDTHYHAVVDVPRHNLSEAMRYLNGEFASACNRRYKRRGHLFEARFESIVIDDETYLKRVVRYVVVNPVRARMVGAAGDWRWSSYRATAGIEPCPRWLYRGWMISRFGHGSLEDAQTRYVRYVNDPRGKTLEIDLNLTVLGRAPFKARIEALARQSNGGASPTPLTTWNPPSLHQIFSRPGTTRADRNLLIREAHVVHGYRLSDISRYLGLHEGTASSALRRMAR